MEESIISHEIEERWGLIGNWSKGHGHPNNFNFYEPHGFEISRYNDAPIKDYEEINEISEYLIEEKNLDQENDIIIYWEGGVPPRLREPEEGPRRRICGISYWFEDGIYYIARINRNGSDEIKFLYAFITEVPNDPYATPIEVYRKMKKLAEEDGLNLSNRTPYNNPLFYILEDRISFDSFGIFESKINEFKKKFNLPLFNSRNSLEVIPIPGWYRIQ